MKLFKIIFINLLLVIALIVAFDVVAYKYLPDSLTKNLPYYRCNECVKATKIKGRGGYPYDYFEENARRGFDIAPGQRKQIHVVQGHAYPIWSNELGCFDREQNPKAPYIYVAGDSHTWGYTPYRLKFATLLEGKANVDVLKCGVTHTGQKHQLDKLQDLAGQIGINPTLTFIGYFPNDIQNDLAHPHSTVAYGWQVNTVNLKREDDGRFVREPSDVEGFKERYKKVVGSEEDRLKLLDYLYYKPVSFGSRYSVTYNIFKRLTEDKPQAPDPSQTQFSIYSAPILDDGDQVYYKDNPNADENKAALEAFKAYTDQISSNLVVVLIPRMDQWQNTAYFAQVKDFLREKDIDFIDMSEVFAKQTQYPHQEVYWLADGHIREAGNAFVAQAMQDWMAKNRLDLLK
ncbi:hypothetical protein [Terasakiella pusilla]|uniref:hypothetical protein n=1 Tax=Terasakiella pusilla TaxID=64973 RepID=UPI00048CB3FF|nr:hypothetical protein [Terasakiella pusilla]